MAASREKFLPRRKHDSGNYSFLVWPIFEDDLWMESGILFLIVLPGVHVCIRAGDIGTRGVERGLWLQVAQLFGMGRRIYLGGICSGWFLDIKKQRLA